MRTTIQMAREAGFTSGELAFMQDNFLFFAELVRADERARMAEQPAQQEQTPLDKMWAALAAYQTQADANGHGETWAVMCREKTADVAAADAAANVDDYAAVDAAVLAAAVATYAAVDAAYAEKWAQRAIEHINKLMK